MIRRFFATAGLTALLMATTWADESTARPQGVVAADEQPGVIFTWSTGVYTYDAAGNITRIGQNGDGKINTYRYDPASRLVKGTAHTATYRNAQTFIYDPFGNIKSIETISTPDAGSAQSDLRTFSVDSQRNRVTGGSPCGAVPDCFDYDASGNQIAGPGAAHYSFDALGAMTDLYGPLRHERYLYDANGERIATLVSPGTPVEQHRYSVRDVGGKVVREVAASISTDGLKYRWTKDYVHRQSVLLAAVTPADGGGERRTHFHPDHLGTARFITDDAGARVAAHVYAPFGEEAAGSDPDGERRKFTGHERDFGIADQPDLDYMHARYYVPDWGRFLSVDPKLGDPRFPQSWNRYAYALNNPLRFIDPTGENATVVCDPDNNCTATVEAQIVADPNDPAQMAAATEFRNDAINYWQGYQTAGPNGENLTVQLNMSIVAPGQQVDGVDTLNVVTGAGRSNVQMSLFVGRESAPDSGTIYTNDTTNNPSGMAGISPHEVGHLMGLRDLYVRGQAEATNASPNADLMRYAQPTNTPLTLWWVMSPVNGNSVIHRQLGPPRR